MRKTFIFLLSLTFIFVADIFAEDITITTYYPAPYGVYRTMRLAPAGTPGACQEGELYYSDNSSAPRGMYYCDQAGTWQSIGAGYWTLSGSDLFANDTGWNVGIGTTTPNTALEIGSLGAIRTYYLDPGSRSAAYEYMRFGRNAEYWAGFMHNINSAAYGNGNDFVLFTYEDRDIVLQPGTGQTHILGGSVGIGTTSPDEKFEIEWSANVDVEIGRGIIDADITFIKLRDANGRACWCFPNTDVPPVMSCQTTKP